MPIWRYIAIEIATNGASTEPRRTSRREGEMAASSSGEVRQSLRRVGLQAIDIRPTRRRLNLSMPSFGTLSLQPLRDLLSAVSESHNKYLRKRRRGLRAELYDSLATMLESGLPLAGSLGALTSGESMRSPQHHLLIELRSAVAEGTTLATAMRGQAGWFDAVEIAMVEAALHAGTLSTTLRNLAEREERADQLTQRLIGALMYPAIVMLAAIGVTVFLSTQTLPDLTSILVEAEVAIPALTVGVMAVGQTLASFGLLLALLCMLIVLFALALFRRVSVRHSRLQRMSTRVTPQVWKSMIVGIFATHLAELVRAGIPVVDAFRILAPTMPRTLRLYVDRAADRVEHGEHLADVFSAESTESSSDGGGGGGEAYFKPEFRRLIETAQVSGDLAPLLERIGERYQRQAKRRIDRMATLLEPIAIITLALLVGTVVMAAVLPLIRLQEVIQ